MGNSEATWPVVLDRDRSGPQQARGWDRRTVPRRSDRATSGSAAPGSLQRGAWARVSGRREPFLRRSLAATPSAPRSRSAGDRGSDRVLVSRMLSGLATAGRRRGWMLVVPSAPRYQRALAAAHVMVSRAWPFLRRASFVILVLACLPSIALAAVDLVFFDAAPDDQVIRVTWETASESDMLGFYVERASQEDGEYQSISELIPARGDIVGAFYEHIDADVAPGVTYWYRLKALELTGASELHGPISAAVTPPTEIPTSTPTPSATPTDRPNSPNPTATTPTGTLPPLGIEFWADQEEIFLGQCAALHWRVDSAQAIYFEGQPVSSSGDRSECPRQHTTYLLRVVGDEREETREVTIAVQEITATPSSTPSRTPTPTSTTRPPRRSPTPTRPTPTVSSAPTTAPPTPRGSPTASHTSTRSPVISTSTQVLASARTSPTAHTPAPTQGIASRQEPTAAATAARAQLAARPSQKWAQWLRWGLILALFGIGGGLIVLGAVGIRFLGRQR
jgi:hypothetical protein